MTYFLSDPIPALCDQALAHYSSALQNQEGNTSQGGCYRHATGRNGNTEMEEKECSQTNLHMIFITILSVPD